MTAGKSPRKASPEARPTGPPRAGRVCAFCGFSGKLSAEHVWPQWVRGVINPDVRGVGGYIFAEGKPEADREIVRKLPSNTLADLRVKKVCVECNTTWMHDIEDAAKPVLSRMIQGDPKTLTGNDLETTATWAFLKALVADLVVSKEPRALAGVHDGFRRHQLPPQDVHILIACYGGNRHPLYAGVSPQRYTVETGSGHREELWGLQTTIGVGHLVLQVFEHHLQGIVGFRPAGTKRDVASVIWPDPDVPTSWPPRVPLTDRTLFDFASAL